MRFTLPLIFLTVLVFLTVLAANTSAALIVYEPFDYSSGTQPGNGGMGWKEAWASDPMATTNGGLTYVGPGGNQLDVAGNASSRLGNGSSQTESVRDFQNELTSSFWFSVLIRGGSGNKTVALGINESFYIGQGAKDVLSSSWGVYDADKTELSGLSISAANDTSLFVGNAIYQKSQDKFTQLHLWRNPNLSTQPTVTDPTKFYSGSIKEFDKVPKIAVYHTSSLVALDEIRFGQSFADVTSFSSSGSRSAVPEPSSITILAVLLPLGYLTRRKRSPNKSEHRFASRLSVVVRVLCVCCAVVESNE